MTKCQIIEERNERKLTRSVLKTSEAGDSLAEFTDFLVTSAGVVVPIPQFARKSEKRRKVLNKALSRKRKKAKPPQLPEGTSGRMVGTNRRRSSGIRLSKHYQKVDRQRKDFHFKTAKSLLDKYDVIAHEALNIKGLAKTRLSKSILDAGWGEFIEILTCKVRNALPRSCRRSPPAGSAAESAGRMTVAVNPFGTTHKLFGLW